MPRLHVTHIGADLGPTADDMYSSRGQVHGGDNAQNEQSRPLIRSESIEIPEYKNFRKL